MDRVSSPSTATDQPEAPGDLHQWRDSGSSPTLHKILPKSLPTSASLDVPSGQILTGVEKVSETIESLTYSGNCKRPTANENESHAPLERLSKRRKTWCSAFSIEAITLPDLTGATYEASEYAEGMDIFAPCLPITAANNDPTYVKALVQYNLASVHVSLDQYDQAFACFKQSLDTVRSKGNESHPLSFLLLVSCLQGMGNILFGYHQVETSLKCFEVALHICEQAESVEPAKLAEILNCLGVLQFHRSNCNVAEAESKLRRALFIKRRLLGPYHASVATTLNNLGRVLCVGGRLDEALEAYNESFSSRVATLGHDHVDVAATAYNIGQALHQKKDLNGALEHFRFFAIIAAKNLGSSHIDVALSLKCIGQIHHERRRFDKALTIYKAALRITQASADRQVDVASILNKMGNVYFETGDLATARRIYQQGLQVERANLDPDHPNIAVTLSNLGLILHRQGEIAAALKLYRESLRIQVICYGENDARVGKTWTNIGHIELQAQKYTFALDSYQRALRICRNNSEGDDLDVASALNAVGVALYKIGAHRLALRTFLECLRIRQTLLGPDDRDVAIPLYNIGVIYRAKGAEEEALDHFRRVLFIERLVQDEGMISTLNTMAQLYESLGFRESAVACYDEILQRLSPEDPDDETALVNTWMALANLYSRCGDTKNVLNYAVKAIRIYQQRGHDIKDLSLSQTMFDLTKICPEAAAMA